MPSTAFSKIERYLTSASSLRLVHRWRAADQPTEIAVDAAELAAALDRLAAGTPKV